MDDGYVSLNLKGGGGDMNNFEYKMACSAPEQ